jgi:hypothetical protein
MATPAIPEQPVIDQPVVVQTKRCAKCGDDLPVSAFYRRFAGGPAGSWCKACSRARIRQNYRENLGVRGRDAFNAKRREATRELRDAGTNEKVMSFAEIGRALGCSTQTAFNIYRRAIYKLRLVVTPEIRDLLIEGVNCKDARVLGEDES